MINVYAKHDCDYCSKAKSVLDDRKIPHKYYYVGEHVGIDFVLETFPGVKTVPIIEVNGKYIGGYLELLQYIEETSGGHTDTI